MSETFVAGIKIASTTIVPTLTCAQSITTTVADIKLSYVSTIANSTPTTSQYVAPTVVGTPSQYIPQVFSIHLSSSACKCDVYQTNQTSAWTIVVLPFIQLSTCIVVPSTTYIGAGYNTSYSSGYTTSPLVGTLACKIPPLFGVKVLVAVANPVFSSITKYRRVSSTCFKLSSCATAPVTVVPGATNIINVGAVLTHTCQSNTETVTSSSCTLDTTIMPTTTNSSIVLNYINGISGLKLALACKNALVSWTTCLKIATVCNGLITLANNGLPSLVSSAIRALLSCLKSWHTDSSVRAPACEGVCAAITGINIAAAYEGAPFSGVRGITTICSSSLGTTISSIKLAAGYVKRRSHASSANGTSLLTTGIVNVMRAFTAGSLVHPNWASGSVGSPCSLTAKFPELEEKVIVTAKLKLTPDLRTRLFYLLEPASSNAILDLSSGSVAINWYNGIANFKGDNVDEIIKELEKIVKDINVNVDEEVRWWL